MTVTPEQRAAVLEVVAIVGQLIREGSKETLGGLPSGELYARLMGIMTLEQYNRVITMLKDASLVTENNFLLTWRAE